MVSKKYKVIRSRIYLGEVAVPKVIKSEDVDRILEYRPVRYSLFELTENGLANDLLNRITNYPVLGFGDVVINDYAIVNPICLEDILSYLGYLEELGYQDIKSIRSELFSGYFASENPEVFGLVRVNENGKKKFIKQDTSLIDSYFLRRFDKLRKYTLGEVIFDGAECMDPFKVKFEEKKKVLRNYKLF